MGRGDEFIGLYNMLDRRLREIARVGGDGGQGFSELVDKAARQSGVVRRRRTILKSIGRLRNAIVHDPRYPERIIADPRQETVETLRRVLDEITRPMTLGQWSKKRRDSNPDFKVEVFGMDTPLGECLEYMKKNDYSQVVVKTGPRYRLLSSEGIVKWLYSAREVGLADLEEAKAGDAVVYEDESACVFMSVQEPLEAALEAFETTLQQGRPRLQAVLVTHSGKAVERPEDIVTPWDLVGLGEPDESL